MSQNFEKRTDKQEFAGLQVYHEDTTDSRQQTSNDQISCNTTGAKAII